MYRLLRNLLWVLVLATVGGSAMGCEAPGVGDPCEPEQVPLGGFVPSEAYLETSSVQCRTRVCMVYKLRGVPSFVDSEGILRCAAADMADCATSDETDRRVYCTCRCDAPAESNATLCECPDGFSCVEVLELGGDGIRGSYCAKSDTIVEE